MYTVGYIRVHCKLSLIHSLHISTVGRTPSPAWTMIIAPKWWVRYVGRKERGWVNRHRETHPFCTIEWGLWGLGGGTPCVAGRVGNWLFCSFALRSFALSLFRSFALSLFCSSLFPSFPLLLFALSLFALLLIIALSKSVHERFALVALSKKRERELIALLALYKRATISKSLLRSIAHKKYLRWLVVANYTITDTKYVTFTVETLAFYYTLKTIVYRLSCTELTF